MRKIAQIFVAAGIALSLVVLVVFPASAAIAGGGGVSGTVTITNEGCIPVATAPRGPVSYTFNEVVLQGAFTDGTHHYAGNINVANVKGGSGLAGDNTVQGAGFVNDVNDKATFNGTGNAIEGTFYGTYQRVGGIVLVALNVGITRIGGVATNQSSHVTVAAQFSPTDGNGVNDPVCAANFSGIYGTV